MTGIQSDYLTVKTACQILGVSPNTLRSWGAHGKIQEYRHPVNNYRLFKKQDIQKLADKLSHPLPNKPVKRMRPR